MAEARTGPRVLVVPGDAAFANVGDVAMAQVALDRVRTALPDGHVSVVASRFATLADHDIDVDDVLRDEVLTVWGRSVSTWRRRTRGRADDVPARWPRVVARVVGAARRSSVTDDVVALVDRVRSLDLLVVAGQGALHDGSELRASRLADLLRLAGASDVPTVMLGQGIGPLEDPVLRGRVTAGLRGVRAIAVRDGASAEVARALAPSGTRVAVTGDDALGLAADPPVGTQDAIGLSVRANQASGIEIDVWREVAAAVVDVGSAVEPIVMMESPKGVSDAAALGAVLDRSVPAPPPGVVAPALDAIRRCRIVVTGTYHGAVLAAGSGIPVVAVASTDYYHQKMRGVADSLGADAVRVIDRAGPDLRDRVAAAVRALDEVRHDLEPGLRERTRTLAAASDAFAIGQIRGAVAAPGD